MTDLIQRPGLPDETPEAALEDAMTTNSLWKIRWTLFKRSFRSNWALFRENRVGLAGLLIIALWGIMAFMPTILFATNYWNASVYDPVTGLERNPPTVEVTLVAEKTDPLTEIDLRDLILDQRIPQDLQIGETFERPLQPAPPDSRHWLGTDPLGRDVMSQLMYGARAAFGLGFVAASVTVIIATIVGSMAAYFGGVVDSLFMRLADLLIMIPALAVLIVLGAIIRFELWHLALVIGLLGGFGGTAIVLKSQALAVKVKPFIDAARVAGGSHSRIIFSHIVPNVMPLSFLYMMFTVTGAIQAEATLSFLGLLNVKTSWGLMINLANTEGYLLQGGTYWWLVFPAGMAVTLLAAAFFLVGRAMDEVINPRLRRR